jgi:gas vesicle protein
VTDNSRTVTVTLIGAVLGAIAGYLCFTDRGRRLRQQFDHALDDVARALDRTRHTLNAVVATAHEGGTLLGERRVEQQPPP